MTSETGHFGSAVAAGARNALTTKGSWTAPFAPERWAALASLLLGYVVERRWFRGKARTRTGARIIDVLEGGRFPEAYRVVLLAVTYDDGPSETYVLPLAFVPSGAERPGNTAPAPVAEIVIEGAASPGPASGSIVDALAMPAFATELFELLRQAGAMTGASGLLAGVPLAHLAEMKPGANVAPRLGVAEQSNSNVIYGDSFLIKIYRAIEEGPNPEHEIGLFLTKAGFGNAPPIAAALEYRRPSHEACTVGVLFELVANQGDAWKYTLDVLRAFFERAQSEAPPPPAPGTSLLDRATIPVSSELRRLAGPYLDRVRLLGRRTAELHVVLAEDSVDEAFGFAPFDMAHQAALFASASRLAAATWNLLRRAGEAERANPRLVSALLEREAAVKNALAAVTSHAIAARRTRVHGDYHLGQVLVTGEDFVIIDFEGEPARPLAERRLKRSPLCDVAGMIRSFHYAAQSALREARLGHDDAALGRWADAWFDGAAAQFWGGYSERARGALFLPPERHDVATLLRFFLLEKCIYEVGYELNNRPDWLEIPAHGLLALMEATK
jgi:maltose alpha-D-glucosyltransferase/alpha-amylase